MKRLFLNIFFLIFSLYNGCLHASSLYKVSRLANKMRIAAVNNDQKIFEYCQNAYRYLSHNEIKLCQDLTQGLINRDVIEGELKKNSDSPMLAYQEQNERNIAIIYKKLHKLDQQNSALSFLEKCANNIENKLRRPVSYDDVTLDENLSSMRLMILGLADHLSQEKNNFWKEERFRQLGYKAPEYNSFNGLVTQKK